MHEYGLAADIVRGVQAESARAGGKTLASLEVRVGALARLETETLSFWLSEEITEHIGAIAAESITVVRADLLVRCLRCGHESRVPAGDDDLVALDPRSRSCAECGAQDVRLNGGTGWEIEAVWADEAEAQAP